ncbi:hypothetical protein BC835DRAFT_1083022 [Cytidiella melzeri]|nr:hypothetical protein BC835DRAFT_1083022 [Cytidiella melzeri]
MSHRPPTVPCRRARPPTTASTGDTAHGGSRATYAAIGQRVLTCRPSCATACVKNTATCHCVDQNLHLRKKKDDPCHGSATVCVLEIYRYTVISEVAVLTTVGYDGYSVTAAVSLQIRSEPRSKLPYYRWSGRPTSLHENTELVKDVSSTLFAEGTQLS